MPGDPKTASNGVEIKYVDSSIKLHTFSTTISQRSVKFELFKFKDSSFLWIGDKRDRSFSDLSFAIASKFSLDPTSTRIMGQPTDLTSNNIAMKLSKKLKKPVYVSFNLVDDRLTVPVVNKRISEEIQANPDYF